MKSFKLPLIVLTSLGVSLLASCSNAQQANNAVNSPSVLVAKAATGGQIEPDTHTGTAHITLKTAAPLKIGKSTLMLTVTDAKGKPAKNVTAQMVMTEKEMKGMGMDGMGAGTAKTQVKPGSKPGTFEVQTSLPYGGNWELNVSVKDAQPSSAVFNLAVK